MKGITVREVGTDSPNIGTIQSHNDSIFNHIQNGALKTKLERCLIGHYDAKVTFELTDEILGRIDSKGEATLSIIVGEIDDAPYTTVITLELTWVY